MVVQEAAEMIWSSVGKRLVVYVVNDCLEVVARGSGDNDLLSACVDVSLRLILRGVEAGAFKNNVYVELAPGQVVSVLAQRRS